ncbi:MAG: O-antigen ligase family protein [Lachnospiraceae bacterium]
MGNKNNKMKNKGGEALWKQVLNFLLTSQTFLYLALMLLVFPLYYENKYYNMGQAKYNFFLYVSGAFLLIMILELLIYGILTVVKTPQDLTGKSFWQNLSGADKMVIAYLVVTSISFLLAADKDMAGWGYNGWHMGLISQDIFVASYFILSRYYKKNSWVLPGAVVVAAIAFQIGILQRFSIDPLGMYQDLTAIDIEKFLSTIGQTTWYSSYAVLLVPFSFYLFWSGENVVSRVVFGITTALSFGMLCTTNSDSAYVGFAMVLMAFLWFSMESDAKFMRFLEIILVGLCSFRIVGIMQRIFPEKMIELITGTEEMSKFVTQNMSMRILLILFATIYIVLRIVKRRGLLKGEDAVVKKIKWLRPAMIIVPVVAVILLIGLMVAVTNQALPESLNSLSSIGSLNFDEQWGNQRGFNWRMAWKAFCSAGIKDKFLGVGPDCFAAAMDAYCKAEVNAYWNGKILACAHNEWLNMLVTQGILGLISYVGLFVAAVRRMGRCAHKNSELVPFVAAALAYMGHNLFCYQQCVCTSIMFLLLGMGEACVRRSNIENKNKG